MTSPPGRRPPSPVSPPGRAPRSAAPVSPAATLRRRLGLLVIFLTVLAVASLPMAWQQQAAFGAAILVAALVLSRFFAGEAAVYVLILLSACATARYAWWRFASLGHYFFSPWAAVDAWNAACMTLLIAAESYSFLILYLGFVQTIAPLRRSPVPLPEDHARWPTVDVLVPTYNEPLDVVRYTVLAAQEIDWPQDKIRIWLLDDGDREEFRAFAEAAGANYLARPEHRHAKAGNINYALARTSGELIAIFDSDHIPTRSFLQVTAGWFLHDPGLGMLQTPHHFYSPDPFERNLDHFRQVPNEGELFYGIIQDTNDLWNATFFCGSCAVLRRAALAAVGGIAHETVTEDAHTSFRMHKVGWNTAYLGLIQSAGLATESIGDHVKQRVRWARGMAQILRIDNPLFASGLRLPQRLCYFNAMVHFFYAGPRLIFLTSPILYLIFGKLNIPGYWLTILVFALPHLMMATITNSRIQGEKRHSFWNEIYETVLSPYILLPTLLALISPKLGKFNVTAKGQNKEDDSFDHKMATPFLVLLGLNLVALAAAVPRYLYWDPGHGGTILMNVFWTLFNIGVLGVTLSVCWETRQRRTAVRITTPIPVRLEAEGRESLGVTLDISVGGASVLAKGRWTAGETVRISFPGEDDETPLAARVVSASAKAVSLVFEGRTIEDQRLITRVIYSRADRWLDWSDSRVGDNPIRSLVEVASCSFSGFAKMLQLGRAARPAYGRRIAVVVLLLSMLLFAYWKVHAETLLPRAAARAAARSGAAPQVAAAAAPLVHFRFTLASLGARTGWLLDRANRSQSIAIALPASVLIDGGELHLKYSLPAAGGASAGTVDILLNDTALASITPSAEDLARGGGDVLIPLPPDQLVGNNRFTARLAGVADGLCGGEVPSVPAAPGGAPGRGSAPVRIDPETQISFTGRRLAVASDLGLLPEPFLERAANLPAPLPFVFAAPPDTAALEAAGVLSSWAGMQVYSSAQDFPVSIGQLPPGNAVVFLVGDGLLAGVAAPRPGAATLSVLANPADPAGKLLLLSAPTSAGLLALAQALALGQLALSGQTAAFAALALPPLRRPNDAPRWVHADRVTLGELAGTGLLDRIEVEGSNPLNLYLHFAPDFNFGDRKDMYLHLAYTALSAPLDPRSNIQVRLNGNPAESVPLAPPAASAGPGAADRDGGSPAGAPAEARQSRAGTADVPLGDLPAAVFANTLQVQFFAVPPPAQACAGAGPFTADISRASFLDMGGAVHLATLPNLLLFANAGYPFTRFADLARTRVLLPAAATPAELSLYLDLMGYFGAQTGYPALGVEVGRIGSDPGPDPGSGPGPADPARGSQDTLVLGTFADLGRLSASTALPLRYADPGAADPWSLSTRARLVRTLLSWLHAGSLPDAAFPASDSAPDGVLEAIRSPGGAASGMVFVLAKDDAALPAMTAELLDQLPRDSIHGNLSLWQGGVFTSYTLSAPEYSLGDASLLERTRLFLPRYPVAVALGLLLLCALFASWIQVWIGRLIGARLALAEPADPADPAFRETESSHG